ncbi:MAG: hypothetical protein GQ564_21150 [Bacteroidales bacterium]|nr:hypothetical protein [Bacteroidales bacterium]
MKYTEEQKEILRNINARTQISDSKTRAFFFEGIIQDLSPENYFLSFDLDHRQNRLYLQSTNKAVKDRKREDEILGKIITYLFLLDNLVKENQVIYYLHNESVKLKDNFIRDSKDNNLPTDKTIYKSDGWKSPTFTSLINKYKDSVIIPNNSLLEYINNEFQTSEELDRIKNLQFNIDSLKIANDSLKSANNSLFYTKLALGITIIALFFSSFAEFSSIKRNSQGLDIEREVLTYSKKSATDSIIKKLMLNIDSIPISEIKKELISIKLNMNKQTIIRENRKANKLLRQNNDLMKELTKKKKPLTKNIVHLADSSKNEDVSINKSSR